MRLTKREKILLFGALIIVVVAVFLTYVYLPLTKEINELKVESEELSFQLQEAKSRERLMKDLEAELEVVQQELHTKHEDILKVWDQAELLVFVEDTIDDYCEKESIDFFDAVEMERIKSGDIGININTNYEDLQHIWDKFENAKYFNAVTSFDITKSEKSSYILEPSDSEVAIMEEENNDLEVTMNLSFYSQNGVSEYPKEYDFMNDDYGKELIFE